jgi:predicted RNase H-like nuclease (RuvC/YqgF family)
LEEKNRLVVATNDTLNRTIRELRDEVQMLRSQTERLKGQVSVRVDRWPLC